MCRTATEPITPTLAGPKAERTAGPSSRSVPQPLTDAEWAAVKPLLRVGRPRASTHKIPATIRFDADVLAALRASGKGWQTRVNEAMRDWLKAHSLV